MNTLRKNEMNFVTYAPMLSESDVKFAAELLLEIEPAVRITCTLTEVLSLEPDEVMRVQGITPGDYARHCDAFEEFCRVRIMQFVTDSFSDETASTLEPHEAKTTRLLLRTLPPDLRRVVRLWLAEKKSFQDIAALTGGSAVEAAEAFDHAAVFLGRQVEVLLQTWLRLALHHDASPEAIAAMLETSEFFRSYVYEPMGPVEFAINMIDPASREKYVRFYTEETDAGVTGEFLGIASRADQIDGVLVERFKRLINIMLLRDGKGRSVPRISRSEYCYAGKIYGRIPEEYREIYAGHLLTDRAVGYLVDAKAEHDAERIRQGVCEAEWSCRMSVMDAMIVTLEKIKDGRTIARRILDRLRTPYGGSRTTSESPPKKVVERLGVSVEKIKRKYPPAGVPGLLLGAVPPTPGGWGFLSVMCLPAIPFVWLVSLWISGQALGYAFVRDAPTLHIRRWIVKQLFMCYLLVFIVPLGTATFNGMISELLNLDREQRITLNAVSVSIFGTVFAIAAIRLMILHKKWSTHVREDEFGNFIADDFQEIAFPPLKNLIRYGFAVSSVLLAGLYGYLLFETALRRHHGDGIVNVYIMLLGCVSLFHIGSYTIFRYFLAVSKNDDAYRAFPPRPASRKPNRYLSELFYVLPFASLPAVTGIGHICYNNSRPALTLVELICGTACWIMIWYWNIQTPQGRNFRIFAAFFVWLVTTRILRHAIYPAFF